jgi:hypothetical protein
MGLIEKRANIMKDLEQHGFYSMERFICAAAV